MTRHTLKPAPVAGHGCTTSQTVDQPAEKEFPRPRDDAAFGQFVRVGGG